MEIEHSSISGTFPMITSTSTQNFTKPQEAQHQKCTGTANNKYKVCFKVLGQF